MLVAKGLLLLAGYCSGSLSFAYIFGRVFKSVDLRQYGSRKLSASNVYEQFGLFAMILVGILDLVKAIWPSWLALRLGFGLPVAVMAGIAAMIGHNWSIFLRFQGGRGIGAALGTLLVVFPWGAAWLLGWVAFGRLMPHAAAAPALLAFTTLPILANLLHQPTATVWGCWAMLLITILKRIEANRTPLPTDTPRRGVLWRRLILDRDIDDFDAWAHRTPDAHSQ